MLKRTAVVIGNLCEHYDVALFGLLAPFLSHLFFPPQDPLLSLIFTYTLLSVGFLTKPLGSLYFGWLGDCVGRRKALSLALIGMALSTVGMGFLPIYADVGVLSPILLGVLRMVQSFCAAGETIGGAIYLLEETEKKKRSFVSSLYDSSSVIGLWIASLAITLLPHPEIGESWRYLFFAGGSVGLIGCFLRLQMQMSSDVPLKTKPKSLQGLYVHRHAFCLLFLASGLSHAIYAVTFTLMHGFVPKITEISSRDLLSQNSWLILLDILLLPLFGLCAMRWGKRKTMLLGMGALLIGALPCFSLLSGASRSEVLWIQVFFVVCGTAFAAPYHAFALELIAKENRYTLLSLSYSLGSQLLGQPVLAISLWLYRKTELPTAPAWYLLLLGALTCSTFFLYHKKLQREGRCITVKNSPG